MVIVGISGQIGSGKSTLADFLCQASPAHTAHLETSSVIVKLANEFNRLLAAKPSFDYTVAATNILLADFIAVLQPMVAGRQLKLSDIELDIDDVTNNPQWYDKLFEYYQQLQAHPDVLSAPITASNKSNYRPLLQWIGGYFLYRIDPAMWYRELKHQVDNLPGRVHLAALTAPRQPAEADFIRDCGGQLLLIQRPNHTADTTDVTERRVQEIHFDSTIYNDGSLPQLQTLAKQLRHDLLVGQLESSYRASNFIG